MNDTSSIDDLVAFSSAATDDEPAGLGGALIAIIEIAGEWASAAADLVGLL